MEKNEKGRVRRSECRVQLSTMSAPGEALRPSSWGPFSSPSLQYDPKVADTGTGAIQDVIIIIIIIGSRISFKTYLL